MRAKSTQGRSDKVAQVAGPQGPEGGAGPTQKSAPRVKLEALSKGVTSSNATWEAYALFAVQTSGRTQVSRTSVAVWIQRTLALRRGLVVRGVSQRLHRIY